MTKGFDEVEQYSVLETEAPSPPEPPVDEKVETAPHQQQQTEEPESEEPAIDPALLAEAKEYGLSEDDIAGMDAARINATLAAIDRRASEMLASRQQPQRQQFAPQQQPQAPFMQPPGQQPGMLAGYPPAPFPQQQQPQPPYLPPQMGQPQPMQPPPFELKINESEWDPELAKTIKSMHEYHQQQIAQLNQAVQSQQMWYQQQIGSLQQQQEAQYTAWFDGKISELGEDYSSVFGKGPGDSLRLGSQEYAARIRLNDALNRVAQLYPNASDDELFSRALRMEFGNLSEQISRQKASAQVRNLSKQTIGRPGRRSDRKSAVVDPVTGLSQDLVDEVQQDIERMMEGAK